MVPMEKKTRKSANIKTSALLRSLKESDLKNVCRWMTSSYILQHSFVVPSAKSLPEDFATPVYAARYFDMLMSDHRRLTYAITIDGAHVGNIGLKEISVASKTAECFIEIGERDFRGRGFGIDAMQQILDIAFYEQGLLEVKLEVLEFNFPAIKIYDRLGFSVRGQTGWHYDEFGQYWRVLSMSIFRHEFPSQKAFLDLRKAR
jgi:RimJ/RimL family protein N-acetyltransferase